MVNGTIIPNRENDMSKDELKSFRKWRDNNVKRYEFYVHKENDKQVYEHLECVPNKRKYLLDLIKKDIEEK